LGLILWIVGFGLESYADTYLKKFKRDPSNKGKFCQTGPWKYCRYPNYLGEITLWFGIYFFVLNGQTWWTVFSPIMLMMLILKFSGLPYLEKHMIKYPGYLEYKNKVPTLIPFTKFFKKK
jgi:steroid 5-alpha reductase family enzyme